MVCINRFRCYPNLSHVPKYVLYLRMKVPSLVRRYEGTFDQLLLLSFRTWGYISLSDIFGTFSKIGRNNFEGTFAGNGKMRVLFCADKTPRLNFSASVHVCVFVLL